MGAIRYRHNYNHVTMNSDEVISGNSISGNRIAALLKNGDTRLAPFGGFLDNVSIIHVQKVKLVNLVAWTTDDTGLTGWVAIPKNCYVEGIYLHCEYHVVTVNGRPRIHAL